MKLLGWNYPDKGNLHDLIAENSLHPIACLSTLARDQKRELAAANVLICLDLVGNPDVLKTIGVKSEDHEKILTEAQIVIEQAK